MQLQPKDFAKLANTKPANLSNGIRNGRISEHYIMRDVQGRVASINAEALADWIALSRPAVTITREWSDIAADYLGATAVECRAVANPGVDLRLAREADCQVFLATA